MLLPVLLGAYYAYINFRLGMRIYCAYRMITTRLQASSPSRSDFHWLDAAAVHSLQGSEL
jgi:hypothetical protein